jgi:ATP-dependent protease Clp ATPase subunit
MSTPVACALAICSFCGKSRKAVSRLIGGPGGIFICNECIDLCHGIIHADPNAAQACEACTWESRPEATSMEMEGERIVPPKPADR